MSLYARIRAISLLSKNFVFDDKKIYARNEFIVATDEEQQAIDELIAEWGYTASQLTWAEFKQFARQEEQSED